MNNYINCDCSHCEAHKQKLSLLNRKLEVAERKLEIAKKGLNAISLFSHYNHKAHLRAKMAFEDMREVK